jgi:2'-5' RNA ligase
MANQRLKGSRARLFVALDLPEQVREKLDAWEREELVDPALRPVRPEALHITLAFLGSRPLGDIERIVAAIEESVGPAPLIELGALAAKPPRRPRIFALPAISPGTELMQARLSELLAAERLYEPDKRPFWSHVTVARVRPETRGSRRPARVEQWPNELPPGLSEAFHGVRLTLYRSELQPSGAQYVPLAQVELPGAWQQ